MRLHENTMGYTSRVILYLRYWCFPLIPPEIRSVTNVNEFTYYIGLRLLHIVLIFIEGRTSPLICYFLAQPLPSFAKL